MAGARGKLSDGNLALLLITLLYSDYKIEGRKRFQKIVCILKHQYNIPFNYEFIPYFYGPYSEDLANSLNILVSAGLVEERKIIVSDMFFQYIYELTSEGKELATSLTKKFKNINSSVIDRISQEVTNLKSTDTVDLVKHSKVVSGMYE